MSNINYISKQLEAKLIVFRHKMHTNPELSGYEINTANSVAAYLKDIGLTVHENVGQYGVVGVLKKGSSDNKIALRADMDALPINENNTFSHSSKNKGVMHACGHDGHTTMLLGAASYLAQQGDFNGTVYFIFQPAEENGAGAQSMLSAGLFKKFPVNSVYAMHNMPCFATGTFFVKSGAVMAAESRFVITLNGESSHSAREGVNLNYIACEIVKAIASINTKFDNTQKIIASVTEIHSNGIENVLPNCIILKGDVRSLNTTDDAKIKAFITRIIKKFCIQDKKITYTLEYDNLIVPTINTVKETEVVKKAVFDVVNKVNTNFPTFMTSDDFGYMLNIKPGCYFFIGNGGSSELHTINYDFNNKNLKLGANVFIRIVKNTLC